MSLISFSRNATATSRKAVWRIEVQGPTPATTSGKVERTIIFPAP